MARTHTTHTGAEAEAARAEAARALRAIADMIETTTMPFDITMEAVDVGQRPDDTGGAWLVNVPSNLHTVTVAWHAPVVVAAT